MGTIGVDEALRILLVTCEWPTTVHPEWVPFLVDQVECLRETGITVDVFSFRGLKNPLRYWAARKQVHKKLRQTSYDVIHAHFGQSAIIVLPKRIPLVVTFHGSDVQGIVSKRGGYTLGGRVLQQISRYVANRADEVILVSERLAQYLPGRPYHLIPMGIDLSVFHPMPRVRARRDLGLDPNRRLVLFGANPGIAEKRFWLAQKAVKIVNQIYPDVELLVMKDIPHIQVPQLMNACDVLLLTSSHEGSPMVVKEALACNLPVVSVDVGDVRQRLGSVEGCIVCDNSDQDVIASAIMKVLAAKSRIKGRVAVMDLDNRILTKKVVDVYRKAMTHNNYPLHQR